MQWFRHTLKDQTPYYVFLAVLFLVGTVFGALMVNALSLEQLQDLSRYLKDFFATVNQNEQGFADPQAASTFWDSASLHLKWVGLIWVCGLSVIGLPGIFVLNFLKGVLIGFSVGYLVGQYSWKGLLFSLVSVTPHNLLVIPVLLVCSVAAMTFSIHMIKTKILATRPSDGMLRPLLSYAGLTAVMMLLLVGSATIETWITPVMMQWVTPMLTASVPS